MDNKLKSKAIEKFITEIKKKYILNIDYYYIESDDLFDIWHDNKILQFENKEFLRFVGVQLKDILYSKGIYNISFGYDYMKAKNLREGETLKEVIHKGRPLGVNLYVDDLRDCPTGFVIARTVDEAKYYLENFQVQILSLDHDLGSDKEGNILPTGYDLVKYICKNGLNVEKIYIHTFNVIGRDNMYYTLLGAKDRGFIDESIEIYNYPIVASKYSGN